MGSVWWRHRVACRWILCFPTERGRVWECMQSTAVRHDRLTGLLHSHGPADSGIILPGRGGHEGCTGMRRYRTMQPSAADQYCILHRGRGRAGAMQNRLAGRMPALAAGTVTPVPGERWLNAAYYTACQQHSCYSQVVTAGLRYTIFSSLSYHLWL